MIWRVRGHHILQIWNQYYLPTRKACIKRWSMTANIRHQYFPHSYTDKTLDVTTYNILSLKILPKHKAIHKDLLLLWLLLHLFFYIFRNRFIKTLNLCSYYILDKLLKDLNFSLYLSKQIILIQTTNWEIV